MAIDGPRPPDDGDDQPERPTRRLESEPEKRQPAINLEGARMFGSRTEHRAEVERLTHDRKTLGIRPPDADAADDTPSATRPHSESHAIDEPEQTDRRPDDPSDRHEDLYGFGNKERIRSPLQGPRCRLT